MTNWPDCVVREPAGVTLVVSIVVGRLKLLEWSHDGIVLDARCLRLFKSQSVAAHDRPVVEHQTYRGKDFGFTGN